VLRSIEELPKQGTRPPWRLHQNYFKDLRLLRRGRVDDAIQFSGRTPSAEKHRSNADELAAAA
jgi:monooxygenase